MLGYLIAHKKANSLINETPCLVIYFTTRPRFNVVYINKSMKYMLSGLFLSIDKRDALKIVVLMLIPGRDDCC